MIFTADNPIIGNSLITRQYHELMQFELKLNLAFIVIAD